MILPPMIVDGSVDENEEGLDIGWLPPGPKALSCVVVPAAPDAVPPLCGPNALPLFCGPNALCDEFAPCAVPGWEPNAAAGVPGCPAPPGNCGVAGGFRLPMSWPAGPT